ncbi:response regulator [Pedobacter frigoris]|uniref:histidine kinase n=1 Tax=Pedobacter frigoris TaxID=2571272 RepID=A0A4U1CKD5_9SPHI|nr:response regulator [Pedobacter frigoris]TKC07292.1 response regulator [Pedobacter frigoris]
MFKLSFKQQVLTGFGISLLFVLLSAITSHLSIKNLNEDTKWQSHTYDVINLVKDIETNVLNSETGIRGFILSGERAYLTPYNKSAPKILPAIQDLKNLVSDNPEQYVRIDSLNSYALAKIDEMHEVLRINDSQGKEAASTRVMKGLGQTYKNQILKISGKIIEVEYQLLKKRKEATADSSKQSEWIVLLSAAVIFGLILFLFSYIRKTFDQQKETEIHIRDSNIQLEKISAENEQKNWLLLGATAVNEAMRGEQEVEELAINIVTSICNYIDAPVGSLFLVNNAKKTIKFTGGYAFQPTKGNAKEYHFGEGLVGQSAFEKQPKLFKNIPKDYIKIQSGLGDTLPQCIFLLPVLFENETLAVIEFGLSTEPNDSVLLFLNTITESIGVGINSAVARVKLRSLFEQTQQQAEELESQQEELRTTNEELVYKSEQLQASEEELRVQQEELRQTNAELEEKAQLLEERNILVNQAREAMSLKAEELEISSKYKSEFLANMSHELRTPLNSILILARILKENRPENLNEDQIKYAGVIHNAGTDLLTLINDILDLSKIESGKIDLSIEPLKPVVVKNDMEALFAELARSKKIKFQTIVEQNLPELIITDQARLEQIVKNLLSNAFKFTPEHGNITLKIAGSGKQTTYFSEQLKNTKENIIAISVQDSGIGIPADKQKLIFEAFQQADGSTSRKYGGTGLGLSISKELAYILGGEIQVESETNVGSLFTLFIPERHVVAENNSLPEIPKQVEESIQKATPLVKELTPLPAGNLNGQPQTLLIVEDDVVFADVLHDYAIEKGFKPILAHSGDKGLEMAVSELPDAIVLDIMLPVMDGWTILKKLKSDPRTKHIPVHMMSAGNEKESKAKQEGAIGFLKKPVEKEQLDEAFKLLSTAHAKYNFNKVLLIEDQELHSALLTEQLTEKGVEVKQAFSGEEALELLKVNTFDCIILDLKLPDISGFDLLDVIKLQPALVHVPVIINTAMELDDEKMAHIMKYTEAMVLKSNKSNDRLIDEVSLFMNKLKQAENHSPSTSASSSKNKGVSTIEKALKDKTVLITDDDMRNIFALSSALQMYDMNIVIANNGREALEKLDETEQIDLVLMDIMMPEMDGYEAMKAIRSEKRFSKLPIIALTAKAMKNDREKCIEAGANDYISKPVDMDKLLSMLRVWLS